MGRRRGPCSRSSAAPAGEKVAYVRMFAGTLRAREPVPYGDGSDGEDHRAQRPVRRPRQSRARPSPPGRSPRSPAWRACRSATAIGPAAVAARQHLFAPPTLETVVVPATAADRPALHAALTQLAEQDPLINLRQDDVRHELLVSLYGEVQKEVIQATLADEFGLAGGVPREHDDLRRAGARAPARRWSKMDCGRQPVPRHRRAAHRARPGRIRHVVPAGGRAWLDAARVHQGGRGDRSRDAAAGPARLAGHRLRRDADAHRLRAAAAVRLEQVVQLGRRLPQPHAAGADERAPAGQDSRLRARQQLPARGPG